jgi:hypothetical protein
MAKYLTSHLTMKGNSGNQISAVASAMLFFTLAGAIFIAAIKFHKQVSNVFFYLNNLRTLDFGA